MYVRTQVDEIETDSKSEFEKLVFKDEKVFFTISHGQIFTILSQYLSYRRVLKLVYRNVVIIKAQSIPKFR